MIYEDWTELKNCGFSNSLANSLENDCLRWVWQIRRLPDDKLLRIPGFGKSRLGELRQAIPYELRGTETLWPYPNYVDRRKLFEADMEARPDWIDIIGGHG